VRLHKAEWVPCAFVCVSGGPHARREIEPCSEFPVYGAPIRCGFYNQWREQPNAVGDDGWRSRAEAE